MSCSQFIEHADENKNDDTLVIIVNGDGTVTVDPLTLERVLSQRSRAAVSVIRFENTNEPDSQTENLSNEKDEKASDDKEKPCRKVNLVIEGYYPSGSANTAAADRNIGSESVVSSTVGTPPLPAQNSNEFLDLLFEELEIPAAQSPTQSNMHAAAGDGGRIGDSLLDAFSVMAPEQLKQVETALHSEKAKQILGDDVTGVLDTLKLNEEQEHWIHLDHCYTNIYGSKIQNSTERMPNVVLQDSEMATMLTFKMGANDEPSMPSQKDTDVSVTTNTLNEGLELTMPENVQVINVSLPSNDGNVESGARKKHVSQSRANPKLVTGNKVVPLKGSASHHVSDRSSVVPPVSQKPKRRSKENSSKHEIVVPERIVTEDEVDGVKVFKPTRNDKRGNKTTSLFSKDLSSAMKLNPQLIQSKLNFAKKLDAAIGSPADHQTSTEKIAENGAVAKPNEDAKDSSDLAKNAAARKDTNPRKTSTPVKSEIFGPALFSTPDIIRKINTDEGDVGADRVTISVDEQTADIEKRMSALENGEAILDQLHLQVELQKEMERITSMSDDDKLLSDLENSADEDQMDVGGAAATATSTSKSLLRTLNHESNLDFDLSLELDLELEGSENQNSRNKTDNSEDKSENEDKNEGEYEDDPNKLWCLCNKPHNNRFMICCDACDNWFHGKCVGISKAIGEKMEQDGTEWLCPSCRKEKFAKERESKLKLPPLKSTASRLANRHGRSDFSVTNDELYDTGRKSSPMAGNSSSTNVNAMADGEPTTRRKSSLEKPSVVSSCVECKEKEAMPNAVYCSADCILSYVAKSLYNLNRGQRIPLSEDKRINMLDKKNNHRISGVRAPAVAHLREWLLQNPSYEIDRPSALPTCRPTYASTFTKSVLKKVQSPKMGAAVTTAASAAAATAAGVVKAAATRPIQTTKSSKPNVESGSTADGMRQISMKHYMEKRPTVETQVSGGLKELTGSTTSVPLRKDDLKTKDANKHRQIKLIPVQPVPSKPVEEHKDKKLSSTSATIAASAPSSITGSTTSIGSTGSSNNNNDPSSTSIKSTSSAVIPTQPASEKKKKVELSKKTEPKRTETKKKESTSASESATSSNPAVHRNPDSIRVSVRKALSDLFVNKMKELSDIQLTNDEISALASSVEEEIFVLHNKDTGSKYKNKYRQLLFNIKQPQNTLFRRIALEKSLSPHELVRLTADEMACTELAEWRQREAKHEIDMIKKTELENLQQSKVLVLKTHKGELEIESEPLPPCKPDLLVPDLQPEDLPEGKEKSGSKKTLPYYFGKEKEQGGASGKSETSPSDKKKSDKDAISGSKDKHRKHHSDHKERRKSSKSRRRSSEREKRRSGSSSSKHGKSSYERSSKHSSTTSSHRSRSVERADGEKHPRSRHDSGGDGGSSRSKNRSSKARSRSPSRRNRKDKSSERKEDHEVVIAGEGDGNGVEKHEELTVATAANEDGAGGDVKVETDEVPADLLNPFKSVDVDLSDMEPTSTVTIKTPPYTHSPVDSVPLIWKGTVVMPDVVKFNVTLKQVSGNCEGLDDDLHSGENSVVGRIDCVGRIHPNTVWDYIGKVKKAGHKDILVLRFESAEPDDQLNYLSLYSYLNTKNRMAVVGNTGSAIKDFYVMPLASHSPIPQVLLPLDGPGFEESRPHLLLAVVVRSRRRRLHQDMHLGLPHPHRHHHYQQYHYSQQPQQQMQAHQLHSQHGIASSALQNDKHEPYVPSMSHRSQSQQEQQEQPDSFTPPHSPTSVFVQTPSVPVTTTVARNDEDEPYSPKDEDEDEDDFNNDNDDDNNNNNDEEDEDGDEENVENEEIEDADEPYSPSSLEEPQSKVINDDYDDRSMSQAKLEDSGNSSNYANDGDRVELYSPSEHFFNDIESSEVTLPATLKNLLNRVKNRTTSEPSSSPPPPPSVGTILEADPIVDAYKKNAVGESDDEVDDTAHVENAYSSPQDVINLDDDDDDDDEEEDNDNNNNVNNEEDGKDDDSSSASDQYHDASDGNGNNENDTNDPRVDDVSEENHDDVVEANRCDKSEVVRSEMEDKTRPAAVAAPPESFEENKLNRDPRRKTTTASVDSFRNSAAAVAAISQPPPPGMEDEFGLLASSSSNDAINTMVIADPTAYSATIPYAYPPPYAMMAQPPPSQMYLASAAAVYSHNAAAAAAVAAAPSQMYMPPLPPMPPTVAIPRADPSLIPLPVDTPDKQRSCEKRKQEDEKYDESSDDHKSKTFKKHKSYETKSSPTRHRSSSYESRRRGYQRDDVESSGSSGSSSRYGHKYSGGGRSHRDRGSYWKSGSEYSSSSHKRHSHGSSDRDRSSSSKRSRWESWKHEHEDRDQDTKQKERDKSGDRSKKSDSSRRS